jgi:hypothetical protein
MSYLADWIHELDYLYKRELAKEQSVPGGHCVHTYEARTGQI